MELKGMDLVLSYLKKVEQTMKDKSKLNARLSMVMLQDVKKNFTKQKNSDGSNWESLKFRKGQPLRNKGSLMNSISNAYDNKDAIVGTNLVYARVHNEGYSFKPTKKQRGFFLFNPNLRGLAFASMIKIPQREYMFLSDEGEDNVSKMTINILENL